MTERRKRHLYAVAVGALALFAGPAQGQEWTPKERRVAWEAGHEFAHCAGFCWALAETQWADPDRQKSVHDHGNGAWLAAVYLFALVKPWKEAEGYTDDQSEAHRTYWRARFKIPDGLSTDVEAKAQHCLSLGSLQAKLVAEMRALAHGVEPK
jgi:hypothetical protein